MALRIVLISVIVSLIITSCDYFNKSYDINHVVHMGQSLGAGVQSLPLVTDSITGFGNIKFQMGTHTWSNKYYPDEPHLRSSDKFNFVPLTANRRIIEGETIANGLCDHFSDKAKFNGKLLFSFAGQGGRYLRELDKRHDNAKDERSGKRQSKGGYYKTSIDDIKRAKEKSDSLGLSYNVLAITWMQGEANAKGNINRWSKPLPRNEFLETYKNDLINLKNDYDEDVSKILNKKINIPFFTYQTVGTMSGIAQLMACDETDNMYMIGPIYMMPNAENSFYEYNGKNYHGGGIHLTADSERWLGEQFGKIIERVIVEKENWKPLKPINAYFKNKDEIFVEFHVPRPPMFLDTIFLPKQGKSYGFLIRDFNNRLIPIKSVNIIDNKTLKITTKEKIQKPVTLEYATHSDVKNISTPIYNIKYLGENNCKHQEISIEFKGNISNEFSTLQDEGVFYIANRVKDHSEFTTLIVRKVLINDSNNTVLIGELDDLRNNIPFKTGQLCYTLRRYSFGNLRDSDDEKSTFRFADKSYGSRFNSNYPLYNWCVSFKGLKIAVK